MWVSFRWPASDAELKTTTIAREHCWESSNQRAPASVRGWSLQNSVNSLSGLGSAHGSCGLHGDKGGSGRKLQKTIDHPSLGFINTHYQKCQETFEFRGWWRSWSENKLKHQSRVRTSMKLRARPEVGAPLPPRAHLQDEQMLHLWTRHKHRGGLSAVWNLHRAQSSQVTSLKRTPSPLGAGGHVKTVVPVFLCFNLVDVRRVSHSAKTHKQTGDLTPTHRPHCELK